MTILWASHWIVHSVICLKHQFNHEWNKSLLASHLINYSINSLKTAKQNYNRPTDWADSGRMHCRCQANLFGKKQVTLNKSFWLSQWIIHSVIHSWITQGTIFIVESIKSFTKQFIQKHKWPLYESLNHTDSFELFKNTKFFMTYTSEHFNEWVTESFTQLICSKKTS